jgi:23S rRNA (cytidine1920-2'-O)/16S rRNA (cytidine1409-2'-O)-methyltransferase
MKPSGRQRLDQTLVELGIAPTRTKAQRMVEAGDIEVFSQGQWSTATQSSLQIEASPEKVRAKADSDILKFVSRGGLKLEGALKHLALDVTGFKCLDLGVSTGGFTDCLLKAGAAHVCGIDVGHGQLHPALAQDSRFLLFEGVNVKDIGVHPPLQEWMGTKLDLCVADLSFISLLAVLPEIKKALPPGAKFLGLVKPQFELGKTALNKAGVVTDQSLFSDLEKRARALLPGSDFFPSRIHGQDGNQEFFLYSASL